MVRIKSQLIRFITIGITGLFLFSACQSTSFKGELMPADTDSHFSQPIYSVAVLPVQNATGRKLELYSGKGSLVERGIYKVVDSLAKSSPSSSSDTQDVRFVQNQIVSSAGEALKRKGFVLADSHLAAQKFYELTHQHQDVTPFELSLSIPADSFLMIIINRWDPEEFFEEGRIRASFDINLFRTADSALLWKKSVRGEMFQLPNVESATLPVHKRQDEFLDRMTSRLLSDFPKVNRLNENFVKKG